MGSVLAGDTRRVLGQIVGDREPRRLVDDKRVRGGADAGIIVEAFQPGCQPRFWPVPSSGLDSS